MNWKETFTAAPTGIYNSELRLKIAKSNSET